MKILNFGSMNIDHVYNVEHVCRTGETIQAKAMEIHCGGKGLNQSIALANAGAEVYHAGTIGEDGGMLKEELEKHGVKTELLKCAQGRSSHTIIQVNEEGNNSILVFADSNLDVDDNYIREVLGHFTAGDFILLQNELNHTDKIMKAAKERDMKVILNPSPINGKLMTYPLECVDIFLLNEIEGFELTKKEEPEAILTEMQERYSQALVVLTLGEKGSCCLRDGQVFRQEAIRAEAVDTTAAGDTFTGYFLAEYLTHGDIAKALELAARASAISVTRPGAAGSIPVRAEIFAGDKRLQEAIK